MMQPLRCELVRLALPIKEKNFMAQFLSPSTRFELHRFMNWEEWLAEVTEETYDAETRAISVRSTTNPASAAPPRLGVVEGVGNAVVGWRDRSAAAAAASTTLTLRSSQSIGGGSLFRSGTS
jgi:hypothetical protein